MMCPCALAIEGGSSTLMNWPCQLQQDGDADPSIWAYLLCGDGDAESSFTRRPIWTPRLRANDAGSCLTRRPI